jgi:hypothetical protein
MYSEATKRGRLMIRVEAILRPAMDRKIFSAFAPAKHHQRANMNESFKKGLRNALTGLYVHSYFMYLPTDIKGNI